MSDTPTRDDFHDIAMQLKEVVMRLDRSNEIATETKQSLSKLESRVYQLELDRAEHKPFFESVTWMKRAAITAAIGGFLSFGSLAYIALSTISKTS